MPISVAIHLLLLWRLPELPPHASQRASDRVEFELSPAAPPRSVPLGSQPIETGRAGPWDAPAVLPHVPRSALEAPAASAAAEPSRGAEAVPPVELAGEVPTTPAPPPKAAPAPPPRRAPSRVSRPELSPRAVALSALAAAEAPASAAGPREADASRDRAAQTLAERRGAELSAALAALVAPPRAPGRRLELRHNADGSCHFEGDALDATIAPDGGVTFTPKGPRAEVRGGHDEPAERPLSPDEMVAPQTLEAHVEVRDRAVDAERSWFLRETQELRDELADAARDRELARASARLQRELERIWCDEERSPRVRRRLLFERWDAMADDEVGAQGRAVVVEFIRANLPEQGGLAYSRDELLALNARRLQRQRFDPYAGDTPRDAGVP